MEPLAYQSSSGLVAMLLQPPRSTAEVQPLAAGKASLKGPARPPPDPAASWLVSKATGMLSLSVAPASCRLKLVLKEHCFIDQDIFQPSSPAAQLALTLQLLSPAETGTASWLLLIQPQAVITAAPNQLAADVSVCAVVDGVKGIPAASHTPRPLPSFCFRFGSGDAGIGFRSLLQTAKDTQHKYVLGLQQAAATAATAAAATAAAQQVVINKAAAVPAASLLIGTGKPPGGAHSGTLHDKPWQVASGLAAIPANACILDSGQLRAQIRACMLDPSFEDLVAKVEQVWQELEDEVGSLNADNAGGPG